MLEVALAPLVTHLYPAAIPLFCGGAASAGRGAGSACHAALHIASPPPDNQMAFLFFLKQPVAL